MAVKAGCDLTCGDEYGSLVEALERGLITEQDLDRSVGRLMTARFRLGMFDPAGQVLRYWGETIDPAELEQIVKSLPPAS